MLYELPTSPGTRLVGPDDEAVWTALGVAAAGRYAVVIGDLAAPAQATVIGGALADLGAYLDPFTGPLPAALTHTLARLRALQPGRGDERNAPIPAEAEQPPAAELVTLPHTDIRVPDPTLRVSSLRQLPTPDGVAYTATLRQGRTPLGTIHNEGMGGPTTYHPAAGSPFGPRQLTAFVAASRTAEGQPISEEELLEDLITEYEHAKEVTKATRLGRTPLRLRSPLGDDEHLADVYYTARHATAAKVTTTAHRAALVAELKRTPIEAGQWWQLWNGEEWEDLTPAPPREPGEGQR